MGNQGKSLLFLLSVSFKATNGYSSRDRSFPQLPVVFYGAVSRTGGERKERNCSVAQMFQEGPRSVQCNRRRERGVFCLSSSHGRMEV